MRVFPMVIALLLALSGAACGDDVTGSGNDRVEDTTYDPLDSGDPSVTPSGFHVVASPLAGAGVSGNDRWEVFSAVLANTPPHLESTRFSVHPVTGVRR